MADAAAPNVIFTKPGVPQTAGDFTSAGGGRCLPIVLNSWPMKPSGVQLARPIRPPDLHTRSNSAAVPVLVGTEHSAEG